MTFLDVFRDGKLLPARSLFVCSGGRRQMANRLNCEGTRMNDDKIRELKVDELENVSGGSVIWGNKADICVPPTSLRDGPGKSGN
jgi:hypothetical protein